MNLHFLLKYGIVLILLPAIYIGFFPKKIVIIETACFGLFLILLLYNRKYLRINEFDGKYCFYIFFLFSIITYIRAFFNIDNSYDIISLASGLMFQSFLFPLFLYLSSPYHLRYIWKSFLQWGIPLCAICYFYPPSDGMRTFASNMAFINVFILCIPFVRIKYKIAIIIAVLITVSYNFDFRSILINNVIPFIIIIFWSFLRNRLIRKITISTLIIIPIVFLMLGITGKFNIFQFGNSMNFYLFEKTRGLTIDSRTSIYEDVFHELDRKNAYIWGLGGNGKTQTSLSNNETKYGKLLAKYGRRGTESGMLNFIQYGGIIGFFVYGTLLITAAYKAGFESKNTFMEMLGVFIAFKFLYSFIEDEIMPNANTFYIFLWIGMCYNKVFRNLTDTEIKRYLNKIFA